MTAKLVPHLTRFGTRVFFFFFVPCSSYLNMSSFFLRDRTHILPSPSIPTQCMACGRPRSRSFGSSRNLSSPMSICWYFSGLRRDRCAEEDSCGDLRFFFSLSHAIILILPVVCYVDNQ